MSKNLFFLILIIFISGCTPWIAPSYTNVEKISNIKIGATLQQVTVELGIEPHDIYYRGNDDFIVVYNYRVKERAIKVSNFNQYRLHTELSQTNGREWYGANHICYIYFKDLKVKAILTDIGKKISEDILIKNNNLYLIQKNKLGFQKGSDTLKFVPLK